MSSYDVRKTAISIETVWHERGPRLRKPLLVGTSIAVVRNPFAGRYEPDLMPFQAATINGWVNVAGALLGVTLFILEMRGRTHVRA